MENKFDIEAFREQKLRNESEIISSWNENNPKVTFLCITYNHELFIHDTIKGFLIQETDFPIEIIIHDDCSTDATSDILKYYQKLYPRIITTIIRTENSYSKNKWLFFKYLIDSVSSEYIAFCEGDDVWLKKEKIANQYYMMSENETINLSFHHSSEVDVLGNVYKKNLISEGVEILPINRIIKERGGFISSASIMMKTKRLKTLPSKCYKYPILDYFMQVWCSNNGALFFPDELALYRRNTAGSWTESMLQNELYKKYEQEMVISISDFLSEYQCEKSLFYPVIFHYLKNSIKTLDFSMLIFYVKLLKCDFFSVLFNYLLSKLKLI